MEIIHKLINDSIEVHKKVYENVEDIKRVSILMINCLKNCGKILICGNGGSVAEAQHFSSELIGKFEKERIALPGIALTTDGSNLTAVGNDSGYEYVFSRQIEALGKKNDVLICLTTSDYNEEDKHSLNLKNALLKAQEKNMKTVLMGSVKSKKIGEMVDVAIKINHHKTARIQEAHLLVIHILTKLIENSL